MLILSLTDVIFTKLDATFLLQIVKVSKWLKSVFIQISIFQEILTQEKKIVNILKVHN